MAREWARTVYLDYQASTPTDPRVVQAMLPCFTEIGGNPHNRNHATGRAAAEAIERARAEVAALIGADPDEIVFTSGATEANNLALQGIVARLRPSRDHIVTCATDHSAVLEVCRALSTQGVRVTVLPVGRHGLIDLDQLASAIDHRTALVSIAAVNNEIGVIQHVADIAAICGRRGVLLHTDAAQAVGRVPIDVRYHGIDLLSLSGHKLYGPKGIGALYIRDGFDTRPLPLFHGGGQEHGLRPGTLPTPLCVGLGAACALAAREMAAEQHRVRELRDRLWLRLKTALPDLILAGDPDRRIAGNLMVVLPGCDAVELQTELSAEVAFSTGSACASSTGRPSHVLSALGFSPNDAAGAMRLSVGRFTTEADIDFAAQRLTAARRQLPR